MAETVSKYFSSCQYWNGAWYNGDDINSYSGSLWKLGSSAWNIDGTITSAVFSFKEISNAFYSTDMTINVSTDPGTSNTNGSTQTIPSIAGGYWYSGFTLTAAQIAILDSSTAYLFIRTNNSLYFYGANRGADSCRIDITYELPRVPGCKVRTGSAWTDHTVKVWNSGAWVDQVVKMRSGSSWIDGN